MKKSELLNKIADIHINLEDAITSATRLVSELKEMRDSFDEIPDDSNEIENSEDEE